MAQPFEDMMSTADLIGASVQHSAAASVIQGRYRQRPGNGSPHPKSREGSFNLRKAPVERSLVEGMILDKHTNNAASVIQGRYRQRPGHGSQGLAASARQGFSLRKGASPSEPQSLPQRSASGARAAHGSTAAGSEQNTALRQSEAACFIQRFVRRQTKGKQQALQAMTLALTLSLSPSLSPSLTLTLPRGVSGSSSSSCVSNSSTQRSPAPQP